MLASLSGNSNFEAERIRYMRRILTSTVFLALFAALAFAESWTGTLVDATCYNQAKDAVVLTLDDAGNTQAAAALKNRADRSTDQDGKTSRITAKVTGTKDGDTLKVESIELQ
jgi:hypothetical protein